MIEYHLSKPKGADDQLWLHLEHLTKAFCLAVDVVTDYLQLCTDTSIDSDTQWYCIMVGEKAAHAEWSAAGPFRGVLDGWPQTDGVPPFRRAGHSALEVITHFVDMIVTNKKDVVAEAFEGSTRGQVEERGEQLLLKLDGEAKEFFAGQTGQKSSRPRQAGENARGAARGGSRSKAELVHDGVFISYSHKDKKWLGELRDHLKPHTRRRSLTIWSDETISPGQEWFAQIKAALASAKVAVLLVSKDFLASEFIAENELRPLLEQARTGDVRIIWIPLGACSYKETELKDLQAAIDPDKPLEGMRKRDRNKAWVNICETIKEAVTR